MRFVRKLDNHIETLHKDILSVGPKQTEARSKILPDGIWPIVRKIVDIEEELKEFGLQDPVLVRKGEGTEVERYAG